MVRPAVLANPPALALAISALAFTPMQGGINQCIIPIARCSFKQTNNYGRLPLPTSYPCAPLLSKR